MKALFKELRIFSVYREEYLSDSTYADLQQILMKNPTAGDVIKGTGGLRKLRYADEKRGKGKRGGLRIIYYWYIEIGQFWLFTVYDKDEATDLTLDQQKTLGKLLAEEVAKRDLEAGQARKASSKTSSAKTSATTVRKTPRRT